MKDIVKTVFDAVFSLGSFMAVFFIAFAYFAVVNIGESQAMTQACYKAGLIKVRTDAGSYCVAPSNLVEVK